MAVPVPTPPPPPGYHGWGAGNGPTGLSNSPGVAAKPGFGATAINIAYQVLIAATGVPQVLPGVTIPPGTLVAIRAHNGTDAGNQHVVRVADNRDALTTAGTLGSTITPDSEISWPCDNGGTIWVVGTAGDGVQIKIQRGRQ